MEVNFKVATGQDIPGILAMMEEFYAIDHYPFDKERTNENLLLFLANDGLGRIWMIEWDNVVIGYLVFAFGFSFEYGGRDAFIDELFLKPGYRQKGIGKLTMDFIHEEAPKLGVKTVHLEVEQHNIGGRKLYERQGYTDNGRLLLSRKIRSR